MSSVVHFILGQSAAGSLRLAFPDATIIVMVDMFDVGPCRFDASSMTSWLTMRSSWWRAHDEYEQPQIYGLGLDDGQSLHEAIGEAEHAILWIAGGATERLHACWLAKYLPDSMKLRRGDPENRWADEPVLFIGHVRSEVFVDAPIHDISLAERHQLVSIWDAFVEPTPRPFFDAVTREASYLTSGLADLIAQFPHRSNGLTSGEAMLLSRLQHHGSKACGHAVAEAIGAKGSAYRVQDARLVDAIYHFEDAGLLVEKKRGDYSMASVFELTPLGLAVLDGTKNRVDILGYDSWFGGTHLSSPNGTMWWREGDTLTNEAP